MNHQDTEFPLISVIIPVYNYGRYLREAVDSALRQTYPTYEVILINDGSTDETEKIAFSYGSRIRYHLQKHQGLGASKNQGVRLANGEYITFLDADDIWPEKRLEALMVPFLDNAAVEMTFGRLRSFFSPEFAAKKENHPPSPNEPIGGICPGAMLIKKASFLKVGYFKSEWKVTEFLDWYLKAKELNLKTIWIEDLVLHRRLHENNNTFVHRGQLSSEFARALKTSLQRRAIKDPSINFDENSR